MKCKGPEARMARSERGGAIDRRYGQGSDTGCGGRRLIIDHCREFDLDSESEEGMLGPWK